MSDLKRPSDQSIEVIWKVSYWQLLSSDIWESKYYFIFLLFTDGTSGNAELAKSSVAPTNGLTRSRRSHFSLADTKQDSFKENATKKKSDVHISYENERLKLMAKFHHSRQYPNDWNKICELYPDLVRNKVRDDGDDKNNNNNDDLHQTNVTMNNNHNKYHTKSNHTTNNSVNNLMARRSLSMTH